MELINCNADSTSQKTRQLSVGETVQWHGVLVFENSPEGIMISEYPRIWILTLRVRWKCPIVGLALGQIWSQIEKLGFLEIRDVPWRISMASTRHGTLTWYAHLGEHRHETLAIVFHIGEVQHSIKC